MLSLMGAPDGLGGAVIGAIIAAAGYVGKLLVDTGLEFGKRKRQRRSQLIELRTLLRASKASFEIQNEHAIRLLSMLQSRNPALSTSDGYDQTFARAYESFTPAEKELHEIIRGITIYALKPTNVGILNWIQNDSYFRGQQESDAHIGTLPARLSELQTHLLLWLSKYEIWIPNRPERALVYLADEQKHGVGFPAGMDDLVEGVLAGI
jgi:hypothetical protein